MTQSSLPHEIRYMPIPERVHLVEQIWDSIVEDERQFQLTDAQKSELDLRLAAHEASHNRGTSWEDVEKKLLCE
jgi:putative addiction module component (TIGR02574 family)